MCAPSEVKRELLYLNHCMMEKLAAKMMVLIQVGCSMLQYCFTCIYTFVIVLPGVREGIMLFGDCSMARILVAS